MNGSNWKKFVRGNLGSDVPQKILLDCVTNDRKQTFRMREDKANADRDEIVSASQWPTIQKTFAKVSSAQGASKNLSVQGGAEQDISETGPWRCSVCTKINFRESYKCEICGRYKPGVESSPTVAGREERLCVVVVAACCSANANIPFTYHPLYIWRVSSRAAGWWQVMMRRLKKKTAPKLKALVNTFKATHQLTRSVSEGAAPKPVTSELPSTAAEFAAMQENGTFPGTIKRASTRKSVSALNLSCRSSNVRRIYTLPCMTCAVFAALAPAPAPAPSPSPGPQQKRDAPRSHGGHEAVQYTHKGCAKAKDQADQSVPKTVQYTRASSAEIKSVPSAAASNEQDY